MVTFRPHKIITDEYVEQTSYTLNLDLPESGMLSTLELFVKARTETTGNDPTPWIKRLISQISVNQAGQEALNATRPEVFQADYYWKTGRQHKRGYQVMGGSAAEIIETVPIMFGEKIYDPLHYIDLSKLNDPKLSITYNLATTGSHGEDIWAEGYYPRFSVMAHFMQGPGLPAPLGYQSLRQIESFVPSNSQEKRIELKGGRPIKRLYLQDDRGNPGYGLIYSTETIKIWGDNEAYLPFSMNRFDYIELCRTLYGLCSVNAEVYYTKDGKSGDAGVDNIVALNIAGRTTYATIVTLNSGRAVQITHRDADTGAGSGAIVRSIYDFKGVTPFSVHPIEPSKMMGMDYLDPTKHAPMYLEIDYRSGAASLVTTQRVHIQDIARQA